MSSSSKPPFPLLFVLLLQGFTIVATAADQPAAGTTDLAAAIERGRQFHLQRFAGGKPDTPACTSCHGENPMRTGKTLTGKQIEPMALSASPKRYTDSAKVEKWFKRN